MEAVAENIDNGVVEERISREIARGKIKGHLEPQNEFEKSGYKTDRYIPSLYVY